MYVCRQLVCKGYIARCCDRSGYAGRWEMTKANQNDVCPDRNRCRARYICRNPGDKSISSMHNPRCPTPLMLYGRATAVDSTFRIYLLQPRSLCVNLARGIVVSSSGMWTSARAITLHTLPSSLLGTSCTYGKPLIVLDVSLSPRLFLWPAVGFILAVLSKQAGHVGRASPLLFKYFMPT